jgi:hypothetical protein
VSETGTQVVNWEALLRLSINQDTLNDIIQNEEGELN